jgi:hypothetical protein
VENVATPDSLPLGQEVVLQGFSFYPIHKKNNEESFFLKHWGPEKREVLA